MDEERATFVRVLEVAKKTIYLLEQRLSGLEKLKVQLETWQKFGQIVEAILAGDVPLGFDELQPMFPELQIQELSPPTPSPELRQDRLWKIIQLSMQQYKRPMTAAEILQEVLKIDKDAVQGENKRETIRSAMNRRTDIFERVDRGLFVLCEWPARLKKVEKTEANPK